MKLTQCLAVLLVVAAATGSASAQTHPQSGGKSGGNSPLLSNPLVQKELQFDHEQLANIMDVLNSGGLSSLLTNADYARQLGLNEMQYLEVFAIIDSYELAAQMMLMVDPTLSDPSTMQMLGHMQWFLELELYTSLTPDQQQKLNILMDTWIQGVNSTKSGTSATSATPGANKKAK